MTALRSRHLFLVGLIWLAFLALAVAVTLYSEQLGSAFSFFGFRATSPICVLAVLGFVGGLAALFSLDLISRRRLNHLTESVRNVRAHADFGSRVEEQGPSEYRELAAEINGMLGTLQRIHQKLQGMNTGLEKLVEERTTEVEASKQALAEDAARRIENERATAERERIYRTIHELSPSGILLESDDGTILDVNQSLSDALGYSRSELIGQSILLFVDPAEHGLARQNIERLLAGETLNHEVRNIRKDRQFCYMELRERAITLPDGQRRIIVVANDVSVRKVSEERLHESENRYHTLFNTMIAGFALHEIVTDAEGQPIDYVFLDANPAFLALTGKRRGDLIGQRATEVFPGMESFWIKRFGEIAQSGKAAAFDGYFGVLNKHFSVIAYSPQRGQFAANIADITEQKRAENQLRLQSTALESAANGIMIVNRAGVITWVNRALATLTGYTRSELEGHSPRLLKSGRHSLGFYRDLWNTVTEGRLWRGELVNRRKDGTLYMEEMTITPVLDERGVPTHFVGIKQDITERRALKQQLFQSQKMEVIGRLAGGIAHDFNNLLQAITGFSHLLLESLDATSPHRADVLEIDKAARRASDLTRQLLAFSRRQMIEPKAIDLNALVEGTEKMLHRLIGEDIQLCLELEPHLDPVRADPGQIEQVLVNLTVNARDAMSAGGRLTVSTSDIVLLKEDALFSPDSRHGRFVVLAITDTGHGMTPEVKEHIFEPFFTTKGPGRGTGLGLSVVYGIVQQHEGMIRVYSEPGQGTTFRIYLPISHGTGQTIEDTSSLPAIDVMPRGRSERILLVEDEAGVRDFAVSALRQYGYQPYAADSCAAAEEAFQRATEPFDLLFTDVVLSDQTGLDLAASLRRKQPELRLLFTSGYMDEKSRWPIIRDHGYPFLQKPYPLERLLQTIRTVLDSPAST